MAIIVNPEVRDQECNSLITYCYLFEPLRINIQETDTSATKLYIEVERYDIVNKDVRVNFSTGESSFMRYVEIDLVPDRGITIDFAEVMLQLHNANVFKIGVRGDFLTSGDNMIISQYIYNFRITTDKTTTPVIVRKLPILGGRTFKQFEAIVTKNQPMNEFEYYQLEPNYGNNRWYEFVSLKTTLKDPDTDTDLRPTVVQNISPTGEMPTGGQLYWKSRFGGWMFWWFDIEKRNSTGSYQGDVQVQMFESTKLINGDVYIPVDYTSVSSTETIELKSLGLSSTELLAVAGISSSPAVYYMPLNGTKFELMRVSSATTPFSNLATGGDFSVSLSSISKTSQKVM